LRFAIVTLYDFMPEFVPPLVLFIPSEEIQRNWETLKSLSGASREHPNAVAALGPMPEAR